EATATRPDCVFVGGRLLQEGDTKRLDGAGDVVPRFRSALAAGGTYCFMVSRADRHSDTLVRHRDDLPAVTKTVKYTHPFSALARVVLPEHRHAICRLPPGDADDPLRGSPIKSRALAALQSVLHTRANPHLAGVHQAHTGCQSDKDAAAANDPVAQDETTEAE
ncbi:MAG: hypothetical protein AAB294_05960, partial [Pseudomonadota bacterium]